LPFGAGTASVDSAPSAASLSAIARPVRCQEMKSMPQGS
jgi:hypothetical protein